MKNKLGKYALIRTATNSRIKTAWLRIWLWILPRIGIQIDRGESPDEFFVLKIKDSSSACGLYGYLEGLKDEDLDETPLGKYVEYLAEKACDLYKQGKSKNPD